MAFKLRKKRYCTMIGVRASQDAASVGDLSIRAQVRYTSNKRSRIPRRMIERYE
jgi:hypothetical protein